MTPEEIKRICMRAMYEGIGQLDLDVIDELCAPEVAQHVKAGSQYWHAVTPDIRYRVEDIIVEGDKAIVLWTAVGTHEAELWGIAPTHKTLSLSGAQLFRFEGGKIVELQLWWDRLGALIQLGAVAPMIADAQ
jgi:predicted ester cyclase